MCCCCYVVGHTDRVTTMTLHLTRASVEQLYCNQVIAYYYLKKKVHIDHYRHKINN